MANANISRNKYIDILADEIVKWCRTSVCEKCNYFHMVRVCYPLFPSKHHYPNCPHSDKIMGRRLQQHPIKSWMYTFAGGFTFDDVCDHFYANVPFQYIPQYIIIYCGLSYSAYAESFDMWLPAVFQMYLDNTNLSISEIVSQCYKSVTRNITTSTRVSDSILIDVISNKMKNKHNNKIPKAWDLWEMETSEYTNYFQWLSDEMVVDVVGLNGETASRYSYRP